MVVVPSFAIAEDADEHVVPAAFVGFVVAITPSVRDGIDRPGDVPDQYGTHEHTPYENARHELRGIRHILPRRQSGNHAAGKEHQPGQDVDPKPVVALELPVEAVLEDVSRVPLVDPETPEVVIFNEQPSHVTPEEIDQGTVRISLL